MLRFRALLLTRNAVVRGTGPTPRREPSGLVLAAEDAPDELSSKDGGLGAIPVLVLDAAHGADDRPARTREFRTNASTLQAVVPCFLSAVDPTILLIDSMLSERMTPRRQSAVELSSRRHPRSGGSDDALSPAELEALYLLLSGHSSKEGASRLGISVSAFDKRVARLHGVFRCASSHELIATVFWQSAARLAARDCDHAWR